jgi:NAD+ kinase
MKIALFGREFNPTYFPQISELLSKLEKSVSQFLVFESFYKHLSKGFSFSKPVKTFKDKNQLDSDVFCLISFGGDGTLLDTITLIGSSGIPVLGINTGRLGFLSAVSTEEIEIAVKALLSKEFVLDKRSLLRLETSSNLFGEYNYALNELSVIKRDTSSMISISSYINGKYLATFWADGLIVSTPTGSTGYSLSCGGPIMAPDSQSFVITPIAPHNLTARPVVVPDDSIIKLTISGRLQDYLVVLDSRSIPMSESIEMIVRKEDFCINLIGIEQADFFSTIRNKLAWGLDKRN